MKMFDEVEKIRRVRQAISASHGHDIYKLGAHYQAIERKLKNTCKVQPPNGIKHGVKASLPLLAPPSSSAKARSTPR